jgi:hypothetical protein
VSGKPVSGETQTPESQVSKTGERRLRRRLLVASDNLIRVPKPLVKWRFPLIYLVENVERNGDKVTITLKVVKEGGVNE